MPDSRRRRAGAAGTPESTTTVDVAIPTAGAFTGIELERCGDARQDHDEVREAGVTGLGEQRAASVVAAQQPQLPGVTLTASGRGETQLVAAERTEDGQDDPAGRALDRRVTITPAG